MAKEIIWSEQAISDRKNILTYWILRNHSKVYSIKLDQLFREAVKLISDYPFIGKATNIKNVRAKKVRDYFICIKIQVIKYTYLLFGIPAKIQKN
jgi:plasmid stabilization system protein ParE